MRPRINLINKSGDNGTSSLFSGERISKSSLRLEALGDLDELVSVLGLARCHVENKKFKKDLLRLQRALFCVGSELATTPKRINLLPYRIDGSFIKNFEGEVKALHDKVSLKEGFVIPGNNLPSAYLHHARTLARRFERRVVSLFERKEIKNKNLLIFLNRLSVYLYLMARCEEPHPAMLKK